MTNRAIWHLFGLCLGLFVAITGHTAVELPMWVRVVLVVAGLGNVAVRAAELRSLA